MNVKRCAGVEVSANGLVQMLHYVKVAKVFRAGKPRTPSMAMSQMRVGKHQAWQCPTWANTAMPNMAGAYTVALATV